MLKQISAVLLTLVQLIMALLGVAPAKDAQPETEFPNVFVHGLGGWGEHDTATNVAPYWGMMTGSLFDDLKSAGYECYAASVGPISSAWDRACELYAQLSGTTVDYGEAHSAKYNHDRYGQTYEKPLFEGWGPEKKINLFGHSFGGVTVRLFTQIACDGFQEELDAAENTSPFFAGGMNDWIHSITTLAAPHNGTTMTGTMSADNEKGLIYFPLAILAGTIGNIPVARGVYDFQLSHFGLTTDPKTFKLTAATPSKMLNFTSSRDHAAYDLGLQGSYELNQLIKTQEGVYYFSYAACATEQDENGNYRPKDSMETMFKLPSREIVYNLKPHTTSFGLEITEEWLPNDGLVNTISALRPIDEISVDFDKNNIKNGIWNVMPIQDVDHMAFMGGLTNTDGTWLRAFYRQHMEYLNSTY